MAVDGSRHDETSLEFDAEVESRTQSSNLLAAPRLYLPVACLRLSAPMQAPFLELDDLPEANGIELAEQPSRHARAVSAPLRACAFPHLKGACADRVARSATLMTRTPLSLFATGNPSDDTEDARANYSFRVRCHPRRRA